jgi:hypothetical protein
LELRAGCARHKGEWIGAVSKDLRLRKAGKADRNSLGPRALRLE